MERIFDSIRIGAAAIGVALGAFLGGVDGLIITLLCFVAADYLTGVLCAFIEKKVSSEVGAKGIAKKVLIFALVGLAHLLDTHVLGGTAALRTAVIFFYLANEGISLFENAARLGLPVPEAMKKALEQLGDAKE